MASSEGEWVVMRESASSTGASAVAMAIADSGAEVVFALPGVQNLALWPALDSMGIRIVGVRHEQAAAYAADGLARVTGRCGIAITTTGPGAANAVAATGEAWASGVPIVVIATDIDSRLRRQGEYRGVLHECVDQASLFRAVTKSCLIVRTPDDIYASVLQAIKSALEAPAGPVYVEIPSDLLRVPANVVPPAGRSSETMPEPGRIQSALEILAMSERPLIWAGGGAVASGAGRSIADLARRLAAPVISTFAGRGIAAGAPHYDLQFAPHFPRIGQIWDDADCVLAVGSGFDGMMTQNWAMPAPQRLVVINADPRQASGNYPADVVIAGDAATSLGQLLGKLPDSARTDWCQEAAVVREGVMRDAQDRYPREIALVRAVQAASEVGKAVFADLCIAGYWLAALLLADGPRRFAYPMGWGTLGYALQGAIGAATAGWVSPIVVCGDGGALFGIAELATLAQEELPVTVLIVDDEAYGMLKYDQLHLGDDPSGVDLTSPAFDDLARAFGLSATVTDEAGLETALMDGVGSGRPNVVVLRATFDPPPTVSANWYRRTD